MPLDRNEKPTEKTSAPSFAQQRGELAAEVNERLSDVNADLFALVAAMNEKGERVFTFSEEDPKSVLMPGGRAVTWHYGIELPSEPGGKIKLSALRFNDKITDADQDATIFSAEINRFGTFDFHLVRSVKEKLDFSGVKSDDEIAYPLERVEIIVSKLKEKFLSQ